ncbi:Lar family restriction alleviation protein [Salmonella enterica]|nr:Lar family restriction alleviation protein [Salmonella enterica]
MTTITRFTKEQLIEQAKNNLIGLKNYVTVYPERAESEAMNIRLAEIALAALGTDTRENPVLAYADSYRSMAMQGVKSIPILNVITDLERNIAPLYTASPVPVVPDEMYWQDAPVEGSTRAAAYATGWNACRAAMLQGKPDDEVGSWNNHKNTPTAKSVSENDKVPTVSFYRDGIEAAANWVDHQREIYDSKHGRQDPDTGAFEFGSDIERDYSDTFVVIAEGIRALHPNAGIPPAPVMPDSENGLMPCPFCGGKARQLTIEQDNDPHFGGDVITCTECGASSHVEFGFKENLKSAWNSRAAMLKGNVQ